MGRVDSAWAAEAVVLADADPDWQVRGAIERDAVGALMAPWLVGRVEHVGSTAVAHPNDREAYTAGKSQFIGAVITVRQ